VTALDVETRAVLRHLSGVVSETVSGTGFFKGRFENWDVAVAEVGAGNVSAAAITVRACDHYKPQVALFIGVAGGIKDVAIGDVVVATKVYGYESGKETEAGLRPRPSMVPSSHALEQRARILRQLEDWRARLNPSLTHSKPKLFVQPIAAGARCVFYDREQLSLRSGRVFDRTGWPPVPSGDRAAISHGLLFWRPVSGRPSASADARYRLTRRTSSRCGVASGLYWRLVEGTPQSVMPPCALRLDAGAGPRS
jgi:nucleoside phosphorylase